MPIIEPKTRRFLIICFTIITILIFLFFTITVLTGTLDGDDVVKIIDAIGGIFKKAQLKQ